MRQQKAQVDQKVGYRTQELQQSDNKYRDLFEKSADAILIIKNKRFVDCNQAAVEMLRYNNKKELLNTHPSELSPEKQPDGRLSYEKADEMMKIAFEKGSNRFEWDHKRADNEVFPVEVLLTAISIDEKNHILYTVWRDITDRKKAEDALKKSNRALKMLSECNLTLVRCHDKKQLLKNICGNIVSYGGYAMAWIGFAEQDKKKSVRAIAQAGFEDGYLESIKISWAKNKYGRGPSGTAIRDVKPSIMRDILNDPNYEPWRQEAIKRGYASSIAVPLVDDDQVIGALNIYSTAMDAFDKKEVVLLMELANDIAFGIHTIRMRNERLQALKEAQRAYRVKTLFLANMSHEIRTPLNSILGFSELLDDALSGKIGDVEKKFITTIQNSGQRLLKTVHGMLDMSMLESKSFELSKEELDLKVVTQQVIDELLRNAVEKNLEIHFISKVNNSKVLADEYCLTQAICNIVGNAIKYTEKGGINIWIEKTNEIIQLIVKDTGVGISKKFQKRMFDTFSQESEGYTKKYQGLGLGLALTKRYLELNNIGMKVESKRGVGTKITLTFPEEEQSQE